MDEVKSNCIVMFHSPFLSLFQGEKSVVADGSLLTHDEF